MNIFAVILAAMFLVGCASPANQSTLREPPQVSMDGWRELQSGLENAPVELHRAITQEAESRFKYPDKTEPPIATGTQELPTILTDILTHTSNPALLPDAEFERMRNVVADARQELRQSYASALTDYLTQSDFSCRQPIYAVYFQGRYAAGGAAKSCGDEVPFSVINQFEGAKIVWLNPKHVRSIHLLFASKSNSMASRFGHLALRLVVCPEGKTAREECAVNLQEHLVLGFQANIDEFSLNTLKALQGEYKAYLFANKFIDVYQDYAIDEFRDVYSLPLRLNDAQRELMVRELSDIHWRYSGEYRFFSNNCATMMQNALRALWPEFASDGKMRADFLRPDSLFEAIKSTSLVDSGKLASLDEAEREGNYFSSTKPFYEHALRYVMSGMDKPHFTDIDGYLQIDPITRRLARDEDKLFLARLSADNHLREAQIMLEELAIMRSGRMMMIEGAKYMEQQDFLANAGTILAQMDSEHAKVFNDCLLTPLRQHTSPIKRLNGIPGKTDNLDVAGQIQSCQTSRSRILLREAIEGFQDDQSSQWKQLNEISRYWSGSITNVQLLNSPIQ